MKNLLSLSALIITLTLTAQSNTATWYLNDTSGDGIQSPTSSADGGSSTAMGYRTTASGDYSTAMGYRTTASGSSSTAMGDNTTASGIFSTAMGWGTIASDHSSLVIGQFNLLGSTVTNSATAFVIGNGTYLGPGQFSRSDALTVLFDGTTNVAGSVTATSFIGDGSQLTNLSVSSPFSLNDTSGSGVQSPTNTASGNYSIAMGTGSIASGYNSTAMGVDTRASGDYSTAMGNNTVASGTNSTSMGIETIAGGESTTAFGGGSLASGNTATAFGSSTASGDYSTSMGFLTVASDYNSLVIGQHNLLGSTVTNSATDFSTENTAFVIGNGTYDSSNGQITSSDALTVLFDGTTTIAGSVTATAFIGDGSQLTNLPSSSPFSYEENGGGIQSYSTATGKYSFAVGNGAKSTNYYSIAMGLQTTASGEASTAMGSHTTAQDFGTTAIGIFNKIKETSNPNQYSLQNTAFVIGNGTENQRSDALTVLFDGTTTIAGDLSINSDARLKANIISLGSTLAKLLQIDGKTYTMKKDENKKQKIGVLAQDIEKVFPELVSESNGVKSVNYQGLVPVLINALKEQDSKMNEQENKMNEQEAKLNKQQAEIDKLKAIVSKLITQ